MRTGAVLAGGISKRFGQDKRFFKIGEKTLIQIACDKIRKIFERRYLIVDETFDHKIEQFIIIKDKIPHKGPLGGIYSFFKETEELGCVFIPVDMPFLIEDLIKYISELHENDIAYINFKKKIYPIPGYYSRRIQKTIEEQIRNENFSLKDLLSKIIKKVEINEKDLTKFGKPEMLLFNLNRPEDLKEMKMWLEQYRFR